MKTIITFDKEDVFAILAQYLKESKGLEVNCGKMVAKTDHDGELTEIEIPVDL